MPFPVKSFAIYQIKVINVINSANIVFAMKKLHDNKIEIKINKTNKKEIMDVPLYLQHTSYLRMV